MRPTGARTAASQIRQRLFAIFRFCAFRSTPGPSKLWLKVAPEACQCWAMLSRLLLASVCVGAVACSTGRPEFNPRSTDSSNSSDVSGTRSDDSADAAAASTGGSTEVAPTTGPGTHSGVNPGTNDSTSPSNDSTDTDDETTTENTDESAPETDDETTTENTDESDADATEETDNADTDTTETGTTDPDTTETETTEPEPQCDDKCQSGESECTGGQLKRCEADSDGCWAWGTPTACETATCATETSCVDCVNKCSVGASTCTGGSLKTCVADASGCLDWSAATPCDTGACSSDTECLVCDDECSSEGGTSCEDGDLRTCEADNNGCLAWSGPSSCDTGACASNTACLVCDDKCTSGSHSCSGSQLSACTADDNGCYDFEPASTCSGNTPVCDADAGRCECESSAAPTCTNGTTANQCVDGAWADSACTGNTPACVTGLGCQPCTEHSQCPSSACHLAGSKKGSCFATNTVVNVNSAATFLNAINATSDGGESVIKLSAGTYTLTAGFGPEGETAIIGQSGVTLVDNMPFPGDARAGLLGSQGITYYAKFELTNTSADHAGVTPATGSVMWLDDVKIRGQYNAVYSNGECHLRRTTISNYAGSGVTAVYGGSVFLENSTVGPASASGTTGVGAYSGGVLDVRYSTIAGNDFGVGCSIGDSSGRIANSIIASNINGHSIADENTDCSDVFTLVTNAVDQDGYGTKIAIYSSNWFVSASTGNLHLSNAGKVAIPAIAVRGSGDPLLDIDGATRPASAGFPGADEP